MVSIGTVGGIPEGDYISWVKKWVTRPASGISNSDDIGFLIDEKNGVISMAWVDSSPKKRWGIYNISDFSVVFESPSGSSYTYSNPEAGWKKCVHHGIVDLHGGAISRSLQTYTMLLRSDYDTIEVWRGGSSALWSRSTASDFGRAVWCDSGGISLQGKYVLVVVQDKTTPYDTYLMLYEGA